MVVTCHCLQGWGEEVVRVEEDSFTQLFRRTAQQKSELWVHIHSMPTSLHHIPPHDHNHHPQTSPDSALLQMTYLKKNIMKNKHILCSTLDTRGGVLAYSAPLRSAGRSHHWEQLSLGLENCFDNWRSSWPACHLCNSDRDSELLTKNSTKYHYHNHEV